MFPKAARVKWVFSGLTVALACLSAMGQAPAPSTVMDNLPPEKRAMIEMTIIDSPPRPPAGVERPAVDVSRLNNKTTNLLAVPTSTWTYGCTATSAGMIFGYYDRNGYSNMYTGPTNGGVCPLTELGQGDDPSSPLAGACSIIATQNGFDGRTTPGHVDDYWISYDSEGPDPWESGGTEHTWGDCTADFLGTNQWKWDFMGGDGVKDFNTDGGTAVYSAGTNAKLYDCIPPASAGLPQTEACHGLRLFAESRGYTVLENYTQKVDAVVAGGFSFADYKTEIDNGFPVMIHVVGHTMVGVGYDDSTTPGTVYLHDTWDNALHYMDWGGEYMPGSGMGLVMQSVTIIHLAGLDPGSLQVTLSPPEAVAAGAKWALDGGAWQDSGATLTDVPAGPHTVSFLPVAGWDTPNSQAVVVNSNQLTTATGAYFHLCEGVGACNREWTNAGDASWFFQTAVSKDGWNALQSGDVGDNEASVVQTTVTGPCTVSFWWKVSSEEDWDYLTFYVNYGVNEEISGEIDWAQVTVDLPAGENVLAWAYNKDEMISSGADAGWLDQFVVMETTPPTGSVVINSGQSYTADPDVLLSLTYDDGDGSGVSGMRFSNDGATWSAWQKPAATKAWTVPAGDGYKTVRAQFRDKAGNVSARYADYILLDAAPPTGGIVINNNQSVTASQNVTLGLTWDDGAGSGVSRMRFSNNGSTWSPWEPVAATRAWTLGGGAPGYYTVRVQYLDRAGFVSDRLNDYIRLAP